MPFPQKYRDLFEDGTKAYLFLATVNPDGAPQLTPVWFNADGEHILINTSEGRIKTRNMKKRPDVAMVIQDPKDPYRYLGVRGRVAAYTHEGADMHINQLSLKYDGVPWTPKPNQKRIIFKIQPTHFDEH
jgi:PPOX class probable F420-dependent enzyme